MISFRLEIADPNGTAVTTFDAATTRAKIQLAFEGESFGILMSEEGLRVLANAALATAEHLHLVKVLRGEVES